ncbi:MAG: hypothetical protein RL616_2632 [Verrucomicrobiota bacterium]
MLYPLTFRPIFKDRIWGGRELERLYAKTIPAGQIGEAWEISDRPGDASVIANGALAGKGASGRFSEQNSVFHAVVVLLKAWQSAISALPGISRQRRTFSKSRKIGRRELYRLFCKFHISYT